MFQVKKRNMIVHERRNLTAALHCGTRGNLCYEFVNIVTKICIYYSFLNYNISDAREIFIFGEKSRDFS